MDRFPVRVYYSDTDAQGFVYHARYLDFAEHARTEMLRKAGVNQSVMQEKGFCFVIASIQIDYRKPGHLDEELEVLSEVEESKVFSLTLRQTIVRGGDVLAVLHVKIASIALEHPRPWPLPKDVVDAIRRL